MLVNFLCGLGHESCRKLNRFAKDYDFEHFEIPYPGHVLDLVHDLDLVHGPGRAPDLGPVHGMNGDPDNHGVDQEKNDD